MASGSPVFRVLAVFSVGMACICGGVQADPLFNPQVTHPVGQGPGSVAIGDLDGNGVLDLAVANEVSDDVMILLGVGGGGFSVPGTYAAGDKPTSVALGLLNGDAALDLAVANRDSGDVSVFLGVGDGTLGAATGYAAGDSSTSVAVGDWNEDDALDLAVSNANDNDVSILLGNGDGTFQTAVDYATGTSPSQVAIGYLDGDTHLDLAVANRFSSDVSVLLGNGDGTFQAPLSYLAGSLPYSVAIDDLDLDGDEDLAVADFANTGLVWVLLGNGDGTFQDAVSYAAQSKASSVAIGDLDQAGTPDLAVTNFGSDTVSVYLNTKETCKDNDFDGYGSPGHETCAFPEEDCDDTNPAVNPGAPELCNGIDDDCDAATADGVDEAWMGTVCDGPDSDFCKEGTYFCQTGGLQACSDQSGNDVEVCDGLDNDCDGSVPGREIDDDEDRYVECPSWVGDDQDIDGGGDCNDQDPERSPGIEESHDAGNCEDGKDNDCDGLADIDDEEGCPPFGGCAAGPPA